ncbi:MAG TPA: EamA family transporter [Candidatus Methanoperedens sp.]|nr:EamA family transporter [Candidatus Methanoperedens sp.]
MTPARRATLLGTCSILLWCWSGACFARGGRIFGPGVYLTLMTGTGAATVALLQALRRRPLAALMRLPGRVVAAGFVGVALYTVLLALALFSASPADLGQVNLLNYLWPIWIVVFAGLLLPGRHGGAAALAGALLGFAGVLVARGPGGLLRIPEQWAPHLLALVAGALWALYCVLLRRWRVPEEQDGTALNFGLCAVLSAALALWRGEWSQLGPVGAEGVFWVVFGGVGPVGLAYHWWESGMKLGNAHLLGTLAYLIPVGSSVILGLLFAEALGPGLLAGALLIALGAWVGGRGGA